MQVFKFLLSPFQVCTVKFAVAEVTVISFVGIIMLPVYHCYELGQICNSIFLAYLHLMLPFSNLKFR